MLPSGRQVPGHLFQGEMNRGEKLSCLIMKGMGDSFGFFLQCLIQATQCGVGFSEPTVGHFKRRQAFHKKARPRSERQCLLFRRRGPRQHCCQGLVIYGCHVQHTQPFGQRSAPQLVRLLQGGFSHPPDGVPQRGRILVLQLIHGLRHGEPILNSARRARERRPSPCYSRQGLGWLSASADRSWTVPWQSRCGYRR